MLKKLTTNIKNQLKMVHENEDGMELIQVIIIILIAVSLGMMLLKFSTDLFDKTEKKADDTFAI